MIVTQPWLIIVTGLPCTGKTTLGKWLAGQLGIPFVNKDGIKELLFEILGWKDRDWSKQLGRASVELLFYFAEAQLAAGSSLVIESNFDSTLAPPSFRALQEKYRVHFIQVFCVAQEETIFDRFKARAGTRHPGHVDHLFLDEFEDALPKMKQDVLDIEGPVIRVDTTDIQKVDYDGVLQAVRASVTDHSTP
jgi:predicted kinase